MDPSSEDPHLCWAARLLGLTSLLLIKKQEADPEEVSWGFGPESNYRVLLRVRHGTDTPTWVSLQDKYQHRVHVPNVTSLRIENLTPEDSGQYRARVSFTGGRELTQVFHLTVYEPMLLPEILVKSLSITPDWCNVTLECRDPGNREDLEVTWESEGLPRELEWSGTPGPAPSSWSLHVNLFLSQPNASLTCVVNNHVDKKIVTVDFGKVCFPGECNLPEERDTRGAQVHKNRPLLVSWKASYGPWWLCYFSWELDCTFGRHIRRKGTQRMEEEQHCRRTTGTKVMATGQSRARKSFKKACTRVSVHNVWNKSCLSTLSILQSGTQARV
ncbi:uncharacterized protein LOC133040592 isoform X3 [Dama dama]|uniref:uncharacterized protein LOC133040592 isoform X3 n=1 Tax=Dama dama TaxID=30532 RepID=UPI002A36C1E3|nr:uncharacterized protein LOC133040592 isoform X3 [Dama dama]XP_060976472.1 uncharacterized protein LOC133040592 isoform X3 [Dama dama]XP_060976473.1 uncharacterized protein LOC133040592 isoform X3 [Dama dama]